MALGCACRRIPRVVGVAHRDEVIPIVTVGSIGVDPVDPVFVIIADIRGQLSITDGVLVC